LSRIGRLTPGVCVAWFAAMVLGCAGWVRLYKGMNRIPRSPFRIRLLPSNLCTPCLLLFRVDCSTLPQRNGIPCSSPPFPDRGRAEHGAPPAWVECTGDRLGDPSRLGSPRQPPRRGICAIHLAHFHRRGAADLFVPAVAAGRLRPPTSAPYAPLPPPDVHLCEMFVGVRPCVILFRHFFILVKSGRAKDEVGRITSRQGATCRRLTFLACNTLI